LSSHHLQQARCGMEDVHTSAVLCPPGSCVPVRVLLLVLCRAPQGAPRPAPAAVATAAAKERSPLRLSALSQPGLQRGTSSRIALISMLTTLHTCFLLTCCRHDDAVARRSTRSPACSAAVAAAAAKERSPLRLPAPSHPRGRRGSSLRIATDAPSTALCRACVRAPEGDAESDLSRCSTRSLMCSCCGSG
jgi:hypothetical protein